MRKASNKKRKPARPNGEAFREAPTHSSLAEVSPRKKALDIGPGLSSDHPRTMVFERDDAALTKPIPVPGSNLVLSSRLI